MAWKLFSRPSAGLDVGTYSVKLLARQSGPGAALYWAAEAPIPGAEPESTPTPERAAAAIAQCLSRAGLSPRALRQVSTGIAGPDVIIKQIALPPMDEREVAPALKFEARKHLPFDPQGMVIDHQILGRHSVDQRLDILLAAVSEDRVQRHLAPLKLLGIESHVVDAAPLALTNAALGAAGGNGDARVLLDIGYASSHLTLYQPGKPYFSRRLDFGGQHLTRAVGAALRVPLDEAEQWKLAASERGGGSESDWGSDGMRAIVECLRRDLMRELRSSFAFYSTLAELPSPLKLWISGGSARLPGLAERLAHLLECTVNVLNPLASALGASESSVLPSDGPQYGQAFGLAIRTA
jgi:type IV pilus assembly protein PilM